MKNEGNFTWDLLVRNLEEQIALYSNLVKTLEEENKSLKNHKILDLNIAISKKDTINEEIIQKREEMQEISTKILISDNRKFTLDKITDLCPLTYKSSFMQIHKQLKEIGTKIYKLNFMNKHLIENSMKYISSMMKKIIEINNDEQIVYCNRGYCKALGEEQNFMSIVA